MMFHLTFIGVAASGQYFVSLPDGRLQTVTYTADGNGYVADVQYSGTPIVYVYQLVIKSKKVLKLILYQKYGTREEN